MIRCFEFKCTNGHYFEEFVESDIRTSRCGCGADAKRIISAPSFHLDGTDSGFPGAHDRWARDHENAARKARQQGE